MKTQLKQLVQSGKTFLLLIVLCLAMIHPSAFAQSGNAVLLNGTTDYISIADNAALRPSSITVESWLMLSSFPSSSSIIGIVIKRTGQEAIDANWQLELLNQKKIRFSYFDGSSWQTIDTDTDIILNTNQWYHVAVTYSSGTVNIYVNGNLVKTITGQSALRTDYTGQVQIGRGYQGYITGKMDEVRIWNVARTQAQIQSTMNTMLAGNESGLVAYYRLNESGQGAGLTVQNSATSTGATLNGTTVGTTTTPVFSSVGQPANAAIPKQTLGLWLRADTATYSDLSGTIPATNGQTVSCWKDMSGNGYHAIQSSSAYRPTFVTNAINGLPEVQFNGTGNVMNFGSTQIVTSQQFSIFVVGRTSGGSYHEFFSNWNNPNQGTSVFFGSNGSSLRFSDDFASAGSITQGTNAIFSAVSDSVSAFTAVNGVVVATKSSALATRNLSVPYVIGNQSEFLLNEWLNGAIVELLVYNSALKASARDSVLSYLQAKYATAQNPLPVELASFTGNAATNGVMLNWTTASEKNNAGFDVERSTDNIAFSKLGFVKGGGTTTQSQSYSFIDKSASGKVFYRLKQTDYDGKTEYSKTIEVQTATPKAFALSQNYPNPFNPATVISYQLPVSSQITLKVYDVLGREVATLVNERQAAGNHTVSFDASKFSSGVYFYKLQAVATNGVGNGFVQTKRMVLVK